MLRIKTTKQHKDWWKKRKIDWKTSYLDTQDHPHRQLLMWVLKSLEGNPQRPNWVSVWEIGCGPGANLVKIVKTFPNKAVGGSDINEDAIELAKKTFVQNLPFRVESSENLLMSDKSVDLILSDASLIYIGPTKIKKVLEEMKRVSRNFVVLCEFHEKSWWKRVLLRLRTGYNAYDYEKLLEELGCFDIRKVKITKDFWEGPPWTEYGYIITANLPQR